MGIETKTPIYNIEESRVMESKLNALDGLYATYLGCGSGIKDDLLKQQLKDNPEDTGDMIEMLAKNYMASGEYGLEDMKHLINWASDDFGIDF